jgi:hypothetical protein
MQNVLKEYQYFFYNKMFNLQNNGIFSCCVIVKNSLERPENINTFGMYILASGLFLIYYTSKVSNCIVLVEFLA